MPEPPPFPNRYITGDELASVSSYMRGRLTADKCNAALDELAGLAEVGAAGRCWGRWGCWEAVLPACGHLESGVWVARPAVLLL